MIEFEKDIAQRLEKIRFNSNYFIVSDNVFNYLCDAYTLKDVNLFYEDYKRESRKKTITTVLKMKFA